MPVFKNEDRKGTDCSKYDGAKAKFGTDDLLPMWVADMDFAVPKAVKKAIDDRASHPIYAYTIYSDSFYQSIVEWYDKEFDWQIQKEWIVAEHGVVISINMAIDAFSKEGDGILVQTPIYPPFTSSIKRNKRKLVENRLIFEDGKTLIDWDDFEKKAKSAKLFLLCSPHNPSTHAWSKEELQRIVEICRKENLIIVSDEIHSDFMLEGKHQPIGQLKDARDITITLHAPSKTFNIAGLNTSYVIIPNPKLREAYTIAHQRVGLADGNPFGITTLEAAYHEGKPWLDALKKQLVKNSKYIQDFLSENIPQITMIEHKATFLIWLDCRALEMDDEELKNFFIYKAKLGLNSGIDFGEAGSGFMRLNIAADNAHIVEAMNRLASAIKKR